MKLLLAITFAASLALAACGSSDSNNASKTASPPTGGVKPGASATANQPAAPTQATDGNAPGIPPLSQPIQTTASGLRYMDEKVGGGASPKSGQHVTVHYTGWLTNGTKFDSSRDRNQPFAFAIGQGQVIKGWDEGVLAMKVGGNRRLIIPAALAYGPSGRPPTIPANSTLIFDVELISVE
jgi:peptidylprolyl isomerase